MIKTLYFDLETTGLNPHKDQIRVAQFLVEGQEDPEILLSPSIEQIHARLRRAERIVGQNIAFDFGFAKFIPDSIEAFDDTKYLSRLADPEAESHSLDAVALRAFGYDPYAQADIDKKKMQKANWEQMTPQMRRYAELDVRVLPTVFARLTARLTDPSLLRIYRFDKESIIDGLRIQQRGLPVIPHETRVELAKKRQQAQSLLAQIPFNPNSPKQAKEALQLPSTNDKALAELATPLAQAVREARSTLKEINFLEKLSAAPRYRGTLQPAARSGRFSSSEENLQNLPRSSKPLIGFSPSDKRVVLSADFAQLELRTIACIAQDRTMLRLFLEGLDLHGYMAEQMYGKDYNKTQRQIAKTLNFSLTYGSGAATVRSMLLAQTGINLPEQEVQKLKSKWLASFSGLAAWQQRGIRRHERGVMWRTPAGRPYVSARMTDHLSIENQGAGAEVARIALNRMLKTLPPKAHLFNFIHDSYAVECPDDPEIYQQAARAMHAAMKYGWQRAPFEKHGLEMPVDVGVAYNIKDADALENCLYIFSDAPKE